MILVLVELLAEVLLSSLYSAAIHLLYVLNEVGTLFGISVRNIDASLQIGQDFIVFFDGLIDLSLFMFLGVLEFSCILYHKHST